VTEDVVGHPHTRFELVYSSDPPDQAVALSEMFTPHLVAVLRIPKLDQSGT
jgi:hypothetical protein